MDIAQITTEECLRRGWLKPDSRFVAEVKSAEKGVESEITSKIRKIAYKLHIPKNLHEDAIQQGWLAHLAGENITTALRCWWKKEKKHYQHEHNIEPEHIEVGVFGCYDPNGLSPATLGLHYDQYHGWCKDDV